MKDVVQVEVPLTAEEAYWYACTLTPYVPKYVPLFPIRLDPSLPMYLLRFEGPRQVAELDLKTGAVVATDKVS